MSDDPAPSYSERTTSNTVRRSAKEALTDVHPVQVLRALGAPSSRGLAHAHRYEAP
jgi:uncharacterized protein YfaT (DUF1175 family)